MIDPISYMAGLAVAAAAADQASTATFPDPPYARGHSDAAKEIADAIRWLADLDQDANAAVAAAAYLQVRESEL